MKKFHKIKPFRHILKLKHLFAWIYISSKKLHPLLLRKEDKLFYMTFFVTNILFFSLFAFTLTSFALTSKLYAVPGEPFSPLFMLLGKFTCSNSLNFWLCKTNLGLLIAIMALVETFFIFKLLHLKRKMRKGVLTIYVLFMQFLALIPLIIFALTPFITIEGLTIKADWDIHQSLQRLTKISDLKQMGIETSLDTITAKLITSPLKNFSISESNPIKGAVLSYFHISKTGKDTLFARTILPLELDKVKNHKIAFPAGLLLFPDNTLVVIRFDKKTVEKLVPILANRMVLVTFHKPQKSPHISFLHDKDYNAEEKKQEEALKKKQLDYISYLEGFITDSDTIIAENQKIIASYLTDEQQAEKDYNNYSSQYASWYTDCTSQLGNDLVCGKGRDTINNNLLTLKQNIQIVGDNITIKQPKPILSSKPNTNSLQ